MAIHDNPILSNAAHGQHLPPSWYTLYELTKLPAPFVEDMLETGKRQWEDLPIILKAGRALTTRCKSRLPLAMT